MTCQALVIKFLCNFRSSRQILPDYSKHVLNGFYAITQLSYPFLSNQNPAAKRYSMYGSNPTGTIIRIR
jgi:hypothetical protein